MSSVKFIELELSYFISNEMFPIFIEEQTKYLSHSQKQHCLLRFCYEFKTLGL